MGRPSRYEIKQFADDQFAVVRDHILEEYEEKRKVALRQVRLTGNSGGYVPALVEWGAERVRSLVLARADAYAESFKLHRVPSDRRAETDLRTVAKEIAAGTISAIRGELDLVAKRTKIPLTDAGGHLNREIDDAMNSALKEGVLKLGRQRITFMNSEGSSQLGVPAKQDDTETPADKNRFDEGRQQRPDENEPPAVDHSLNPSVAAEKKARAKLLQNLKQCWPRIFPQGRRAAARDYSVLIPSFCTYAQDLFDAYMKGSDVENIIFWEHVEAIQTAIVHRIAPEPLRGRSWGFEVGEFEAVVEWTRDGWVMKIRAPREGGGHKWAGLRSVPDLETGKSLAFSEATNRAGLNPEEIERLRKTREWNDRGYPPKDLFSLIRADLPDSPGAWEQFVMMSWRRFDHPWGVHFHTTVQSWFVEVTREPEAHSKLVSSLLKGLYERIDYWDAAIEERKASAQKELGRRQDKQRNRKGPKKRGRRSNPTRKDAIRKAIEKHGEDWREHLSEIFTELDSGDVPLGDLLGREIDLGDGDSTRVSKWTDLDLSDGDQRRKIVDLLRKYAP